MKVVKDMFLESFLLKSLKDLVFLKCFFCVEYFIFFLMVLVKGGIV